MCACPGLLSFDSVRVIGMTDAEMTCGCHVHEYDTNSASANPTGLASMHAEVTMTLARQELKGTIDYVVTSCTFNIVWYSSNSGLAP
jgi:hypothetical protein